MPEWDSTLSDVRLSQDRKSHFIFGIQMTLGSRLLLISKPHPGTVRVMASGLHFIYSQVSCSSVIINLGQVHILSRPYFHMRVTTVEF
jgi:hypothetical protein